MRISLFLLVLFLAPAALAQSGFTTKAKQAMMIDYQTGEVLFEKNAHEHMPPSSMSKLMTLYILFDRLKKGALSLDDTFMVSEKAWRKGGSKMFVEVGKEVSIEDLIRGIIVQSGNDACIVVAEGISGSEDGFADEMNFVAEELGMTGSHFKNSTGWPDGEHFMTARDLVLLSNRLVHDFPEYYPYFAEKSFTYSGIKQPNRNKLVNKPELGVDGLKTGHTEAAGYGIAVSSLQEGRRVVLVINGTNSEKERLAEAQKLVRHAYRDFNNVLLYRPKEPIENAAVWLGQEETVPLVAKEDVLLTLRRLGREQVKLDVTYAGPLPAPVLEGAHVASLNVTKDGKTVTLPLYAGKTVEKVGYFGRMKATLAHFFSGE